LALSELHKTFWVRHSTIRRGIEPTLLLRPDTLTKFLDSGRAVGSFLAGQLVGSLEMTIPKTFKILGLTSFVGGLICFLIYKLVRVLKLKKTS
jgi:hypothetical protein